MNPYSLLAGLLIWGASLGAATWWAWHAGSDHEIARLAREDDIEQRAIVASTDAAASAIAAIKVRNTTIQNEVQHEVSERVVYRECLHSPEQLQRLNAALTGAQPAAADGKLPAADAARGSELRRDDPQAH
jgi:hypothetical protein